jgi:hypothetical protein
MVDPSEAAMFLAVGFVPTLIALELAYRMCRAIGRRGEISSLAQNNMAEDAICVNYSQKRLVLVLSLQ